MIDEAAWDTLGEELAAFDKTREEVIKTSRDVQKLSKQAIFSLHRNDIERAEKQLEEAITIARSLIPLTVERPQLRNGSLSNSLEEWAEGVIFLAFLKGTRIISSSMLSRFQITTTTNNSNNNNNFVSVFWGGGSCRPQTRGA